jgi:cytochrome c-type biogenesis protein CcsB
MFAAILYSGAVLSHLYEWSFSRNSSPANQLVSVGGSPSNSAGSDLADAKTAYRVEFAGTFGVVLTTIAFLLHASAVVSRGLAADRVPWGNMYEFTITGTAASIATYLIWLHFQPVRWLGLPMTGLTVILLMVGVLLLDVPAGPLVPALQSYWLYIHVTAALIATGAFTVGAVASTLFLIRSRAEDKGTQDSGASSRLPDAETIDQFAYRIHAFAFPVWTFAALIAGPIWARFAWGRYWGWDPKEVWAFITWVAYAAYLHARATSGWRGRRAALLALAGFAALWFNFIGVNFFISGLHSYAGK